jgi:hypothetical protein
MGTISVILLIAIIGGGVYFFIKKSKQPKSEPKKPTNWNEIKPTQKSKKDSEPKGFDTSSLQK